MKMWGAYLHEARSPLLLRDGFSVWAFLLGPLWLLVHAAWIPCAVLFAIDIVLRLALPPPAAAALGLGIAWLVGLYGQSLRGWSLRRRGWRLAHLVAAPDADTAYMRLLTVRPDTRGAATL